MNNSLYYLGSGFSLGVFVGYLLRKNWFVIRSLFGAKLSPKETQNNKKPGQPTKSENSNIEKVSSETSSGAPSSLNFNDDFKMVLVVRNDLKMGKGKAAAQCSHATLGCYKAACKNPRLLAEWEDQGQAKVVLKCETEDELNELKKAATQKGLISNIIRDAGRTQIAAGSKTVIGIGPGPAKLIDEVTGHLKLF